MRISKSLSKSVAVFMALFISNVPATAAVVTDQMISTSSVAADLTRAQAQANIENILQNGNVREELMKRGLSADEITSRLASLSENEMRQLSGQMDQARAGGDILVAILVVVLIIFLIKRI